MEAVLLNSGGVDTLASIIKLKEGNFPLVLHSLFINLGQENADRANQAAYAIAQEHCASHDIFGFSQDMTTEDLDNPGGRRRTPYFGTLIYILAAVKARQLNIKYMISGIDNYFIESFSQKFSSLLAEDSRSPYTVIPVQPIADFSREERLQIILGNPLAEITVSCQKAEVCGVCNKCKERLSVGLNAN